MRRIAILGVNGQLGSDCRRIFEGGGWEVTGFDHQQLEISDASAVQDALTRVRPDVVINTAAMHNVEECEADPARAFVVNAIGAWNLARTSREIDARLLQISTDYVFGGARHIAYTENDLPCPLNVYGNSKLSGEYFVLSEAPRGIVVRTSGLYGSSPCRGKGGLNFVRRMLKLARERGEVRVVKGEIISPTYTLDLARQLLLLADWNEGGVFHATSSGECSWFEFAAEIFALTGTDVRLGEASPGDLPSKVRRPAYSVLENTRLAKAGIDRMPHWRDALISYLAEIGELSVEIPGPVPI